MLKKRWLTEVASRVQPPDILAQCGARRWPCGRRALAFWSGSLQLDTSLCSGSPSGLPRGALLKTLVSFFQREDLQEEVGGESVEPRWRLPSVASRLPGE